jgi:hypothetical protein
MSGDSIPDVIFEVHNLVTHKLNLEINNKILDSLLNRLKEVF